MNAQPPSSSIWWRCAVTVFRWLLRLYPRRFREAYGAQMLQDFRDLWEEAALQRGALGVCHVCWETLGDLVVTAIAEQLRKEPAMERRIVVRIGAALIWAAAVLEALSVQVVNLPFPDAVARFLTLNWTRLGFEAVILVGLVGLQLKYRQRMPWYIWVIGGGTALAYFCWRLLPMLLTQVVYLVSGIQGLYSIYYTYNVQQMRSVFFAIYLVYTVGMLVWGVSTLLKGVLPRWTAVLLILFGVDSLLRWPVIPSGGPFIGEILRGLNVWADPSFASVMPYILIRCLLLAGLGCALWVHTRLGSAPSEPNAAGPAPPSLPEGVDPAV